MIILIRGVDEARSAASITLSGSHILTSVLLQQAECGAHEKSNQRWLARVRVLCFLLDLMEARIGTNLWRQANPSRSKTFGHNWIEKRLLISRSNWRRLCIGVYFLLDGGHFGNQIKNEGHACDAALFTNSSIAKALTIGSKIAQLFGKKASNFSQC